MPPLSGDELLRQAPWTVGWAQLLRARETLQEELRMPAERAIPVVMPGYRLKSILIPSGQGRWETGGERGVHGKRARAQVRAIRYSVSDGALYMEAQPRPAYDQEAAAVGARRSLLQSRASAAFSGKSHLADGEGDDRGIASTTHATKAGWRLQASTNGSFNFPNEDAAEAAITAATAATTASSHRLGSRTNRRMGRAGQRQRRRGLLVDDPWRAWSSSSVYPFSALAYIRFPVEGDTFFRCSGTFITPWDVLTAAHCVWNFESSTGFTNWSIYPGLDSRPFNLRPLAPDFVTFYRTESSSGAGGSSRVYNISAQRNSLNYFDIAVIRVKSPHTSWLGIKYDCTRASYPKTLACGYPADTNIFAPLCVQCFLSTSQCRPTWMMYNYCRSTPGSSGMSVMDLSDLRVLGVLSGGEDGDTDYSYWTPIDAFHFSNIVRWMWPQPDGSASLRGLASPSVARIPPPPPAMLLSRKSASATVVGPEAAESLASKAAFAAAGRAGEGEDTLAPPWAIPPNGDTIAPQGDASWPPTYAGRDAAALASSKTEGGVSGGLRGSEPGTRESKTSVIEVDEAAAPWLPGDGSTDGDTYAPEYDSYIPESYLADGTVPIPGLGNGGGSTDSSDGGADSGTGTSTDEAQPSERSAAACSYPGNVIDDGGGDGYSDSDGDVNMPHSVIHSTCQKVHAVTELGPITLMTCGAKEQDKRLAGTNGQLRLMDGPNAWSGRLEICRNNVWGTICDMGWGWDDARVACRQLGFPAGGEAIQGGWFPSAAITIPVHIGNVTCLGSEGSLTDCRLPTPPKDCYSTPGGVVDHRSDAGLICLQNDPSAAAAAAPPLSGFTNGSNSWQPADNPCSQEGGLRLVQNDNTIRTGSSTVPAPLVSGRVEVCSSGQWGSICDDDWGNADAMVACKQLGYPSAVALSGGGNLPPQLAALGVVKHSPGPLNMSIWVSNVDCTGAEDSLLACRRRTIASGFRVPCTHQEDAGVVCFNTPAPVAPPQPPPPECSEDGALRLVPIAGRQGAGRLEVCYSGRYGLVCDNGFGMPEARVACRQLGYLYGRPMGPSNSAVAGDPGPGAFFWMDNVRCSIFKVELGFWRLIQCRFSGWGGSTCNPRTQAVGLLCSNDPASIAALPPQQPPLPPPSPPPPSSHAFYVRPLLARSLHYLVAPLIAPSINRPHALGTVEGAVRVVAAFDNVQTSLPAVGRVDICRNNVWGAICTESGNYWDSWDSRSAAVVCRQLNGGITASVAQALGGYNLGASALPPGMRYWRSSVKCTSGNEPNLVACLGSSFVATETCGSGTLAGVRCLP
ncbi:hypothetical protein VOLCADRAFT_94662 [Volvox carteri f. nagariensis]|uniref:SRCR domain-containing protein n=1 Tax=Volvox carteri f. nagariensis TaxID=3068 RepID=D8U5E1_VOLCA|nr:uncharacterized protein VOLCADRAFT_94662 [Volvox carteri f. nagariensis]EFJ44984.1 hypothetical protein VOLCADRAFT_94662 [Volvox carteri f. nagariensis]|eukprot:XP_002953955.1 hypothetical protein VOLCADRAFT_94662 [Volvox carteri f. nagariensis]